MLGESPFAQGPLVDEIGKDVEGSLVENILGGTFERDLIGMDDATASSEM